MSDPLALARRAVACPSWRWMPGMLAIGTFGKLAPDRWRVYNEVEGSVFLIAENGDEAMGSPDYLLPDLTDPATLGCVLALVREAWGPLARLVRLATVHQPNGPGSDFEPRRLWALSVADDGKPLLLDLFNCWRYVAGPTEAAALVAALEARRV